MDSGIRASYPLEAKDFSRRLRKGTGADLTASGATRVAGTLNYKRKYEPDFHTVAIGDTVPGRIMTPAQLELFRFFRFIKMLARDLSSRDLYGFGLSFIRHQLLKNLGGKDASIGNRR